MQHILLAITTTTTTGTNFYIACTDGSFIIFDVIFSDFCIRLCVILNATKFLYISFLLENVFSKSNVLYKERMKMTRDLKDQPRPKQPTHIHRGKDRLQYTPHTQGRGQTVVHPTYTHTGNDRLLYTPHTYTGVRVDYGTHHTHTQGRTQTTVHPTLIHRGEGRPRYILHTQGRGQTTVRPTPVL